jgi:hypothetical protein
MADSGHSHSRRGARELTDELKTLFVETAKAVVPKTPE